MKKPNQSNIVTYRTAFLFWGGGYTLFAYLQEMNLIKMQIPSCKYKRVLYATLRYIRIGLATIGVCIFSAVASVAALFSF